MNNMKKVPMSATTHSSVNEKIEKICETADAQGVHISFKLEDRLKERGLTRRDCAKMSGLRLATISDLCTGKKQSINIHHIFVLMVVLRISNMADLVEISIPENIKEIIDTEGESWVATGDIPKTSQIISSFINGEIDENGMVVK